MKLITCQDCFNSYYTTETNCPHCTSGSPAPRVPLALLLGLGLSACEELTPETKAVYGVEIVDEDGDGQQLQLEETAQVVFWVEQMGNFHNDSGE